MTFSKKMGYKNFRGLLIEYSHLRCREYREKNLRTSTNSSTCEEERPTTPCLSPEKKLQEFEGLFLFDEDICSSAPASKESSRLDMASIHDASECIEDSMLSFGDHEGHQRFPLYHSDPIDIPRKSCWVSSRRDDSCSPSFM
eukprot:CAMPEP_0196656970 /NCGR_PEP_ID=MMETSP1086-20130531/20792_1 /TAXON_ID=77921 /ORGANISM="Cyanoptyche  gloeocystis , Strain SAG4.97" /LENGTH=141 /DNA_ID=CAMNT_0041989921 /DNA_START=92 /DNA_END=517 /DNA_ORIENTATION=+